MKFDLLKTNTFKELQLNAGILLSEFAPATAEVSPANIIGATMGGVSFSDTVTYIDFGGDIDNCPKNTKELKKIDGREVRLSGTFVTIDGKQAKSLAGAADLAETTETKITPRDDLKPTDFSDLWWVGDYSDENGKTNGGFMAIHMKNALSTGGFSFKSADKEKGQFTFEYMAHYSIDTPDDVPYEIYIKNGSAEA